MIGNTGNTVLRHSRQQARPPRKVCPFCFEGDHIGGRNHIPHVTIEICQLHHSLLTEQRLAAGADMNKQRHTIKLVEMAIRSLIVTGHAIALAVEKLCEALEFCADKLRAFYEASLRARVKSPNKWGRKHGR